MNWTTRMNWSGNRVELDANTASFIMKSDEFIPEGEAHVNPLMKNTLDNILSTMKNMYLYYEEQYKSGLIKQPLQSGTILTYKAINQPTIQVEYNTDIIGGHYEQTTQICNRIIAQILTTKCWYRNAQILTAAGNYYMMYQKDHIKLSDLDSIQLSTTVVYADVKFAYKVNLIKLYVSYDNDDVRIWCRHYGTFTEIDPKNSIMLKPIQSIEIDSAVDYKLMQDIDLGYKHY